MSLPVALIQTAATTDNTTLIILGVIILASLVVLGFRFFVNLFEVITSPTASIQFHGRQDNFFISLMVVFLGGAIGSLVLIINRATLVTAFNDFAKQLMTSVGQGNANTVYRDTATQMGLDRMTSGFASYIVDNLLWFCIVMVALWLVIGTFAFLFAKMFGGHSTFGDYLGALAYACFFLNIGLGLAGVLLINIAKVMFLHAPLEADAMAIAGAVIWAYGLILYLIAIARGADLATGQAVGVVIALLIVLGGAAYAGYYFGNKTYEAFKAEITAFDPSKNKI